VRRGLDAQQVSLSQCGAICAVAMRRPPSASLHRSEGCRGGSYPCDRLFREIKDGGETSAKLFVRGGLKSTTEHVTRLARARLVLRISTFRV
jgi:hypothetical protein